MSRYRYPRHTPSTVYLLNGAGDAPGDVWAAAMLREGSVLLVPRKGPVPRVVLDEVRRLAPSRVVAIGGSDVVSDATLRSVAGGRRTARVEGATRYDTAVAVARSVYRGKQSRVYLASGPFSQTGPLTALGPVLPFPQEGQIPDALAVAMRDFAPSEVVLVGWSPRDRTGEVLDLAPSLGGGVVLSPRLRLLQAGDLAGIGTQEGLPSSVSLTRPAAALGIGVGDLVTAGYHPTRAPAGLLARVLAIGSAPDLGRSLLTVAPARLSDAIVSVPSERRLTLWPVVDWYGPPPKATMAIKGSPQRGLGVNRRELATVLSRGILTLAAGVPSAPSSIRMEGWSNWSLSLSRMTPEAGTSKGRFAGAGQDVVQGRIGLLPLVIATTYDVRVEVSATPVSGATAITITVHGGQQATMAAGQGHSTLAMDGHGYHTVLPARGPVVRVGRSAIDLTWRSEIATRWYGMGGYTSRASAGLSRTGISGSAPATAARTVPASSPHWASRCSAPRHRRDR